MANIWVISDTHFGPPYLNVSVEVIDYTPINLDDCRKRFTKGQP